jgi:hypothetical protein
VGIKTIVEYSESDIRTLIQEDASRKVGKFPSQVVTKTVFDIADNKLVGAVVSYASDKPPKPPTES